MINDYLNLSAREDVIILDSVDSTNTYMLNRIKSDPPASGALTVVSDRQTGGRGRFTRSFYSPSSTGIYMTYAFRSNLDEKSLLSVTPVTAALLHQELSAYSDSPLRIKWVNDLYNDSGKIAGILTELLDVDSSRWIVIGAGINVLKPADLPSELRDVIGNLAKKASRDEIACRMHDAFARVFRPDAVSLPSMHEYYTRNCLSIGRHVTVRNTNGDSYEAQSIDINDSYALVVVPSGSDSAVTVFSGEVSVSV